MRATLPQILLVVAIILLLFGARKLPDLARGVAQSLNIFKSEMSKSDSEDKDAPKSESTSEKQSQESPGGASDEVDTTKDPLF